MSVESLSFLLAAIISAALAIGMFIRGTRDRLHLSFSVLNAVLFVYYLASFVSEVSEFGFWYRLGILSALAIPTAAIRFFTIFLGHHSVSGNRAIQVSITLSLLLAPFVFSDLINQYVIKAVVVLFVFASLFVCMLMIFDRLRLTTSRVESARLKYLLSGGVLAVLFSMSNFLPGVGAEWSAALGNMFTVIYLYFLSQIIIQFRLLDLNELIGKILVLATLVSVLATIYSLIGIFVSNIPGLIFFNTFVAGFVVLILFDPIDRLFEEKVNRLLFRERYEFGRQLSILRRELANVVDVGKMCHLVLTRLENSRRLTSASIYLLEDETSNLACLGYIGKPPVDTLDAVSERPFFDRVIESKFLLIEAIEAELNDLLASDSRRLAEADALRETVRVLRALEADLTMAMISEDRVIGLVNVSDDRMTDAYSPEEIAHFVAIANQSTICVENSRIVKTMRDRDRLAAIGEMAAGLAHEVRNPLGAIKGAAQILADETTGAASGTDDADNESAEFVEIIVEEVNRLDKVVSAFLDYAKPYGGTAEPTKANEVIERVMTLIRTHASESNVMVNLELDSAIAQVRIDPEVLRQVLWNLALNAVEAMQEEGSGTLTVATRQVNRAAPLHAGYFGHEVVEILLIDTGPGISEADLDRIFIPFYTTKSRGTGLGLAICQRLIRAANGTISVSSKENEGTTFAIRLPLWTDEIATSTAERGRITGKQSA